MPLSDEATSEQVQLALAALTNRFSIVTKTEPVASRSRPPLLRQSPRFQGGPKAPGARLSKDGKGVGVQARPAAPSLPLDAVVEVRAELDAAVRGQCW